MSDSIYKSVLRVRGGKGGDGSVSFLHEAGKPKGGPDGGDGGSGGDVIIRGDNNKSSIEHLHHYKEVKAGEGGRGGARKKKGKDGKDKIIHVPAGTIIYDKKSGESIREIESDNDSFVVACGGEGGKGNSNFATSENQTPRKATAGESGDIIEIELKFSPYIDIAVLGPPNTGKSSIIKAMTGKELDIAEYPYSTRKPHIWSTVWNFEKVRFLDTPPLRKEMLEDFIILTKRAKLYIIVLSAEDDLKKQFAFMESAGLEEIVKSQDYNSTVIAINKIEKIEGRVRDKFPCKTFLLSVKIDRGIDILKSYIKENLGIGE